VYYVNFIFIGIVVGSIYALYGLGITVVYKATRVPNFAQGAIGTTVAFVFYKVWGGSGVQLAVREHSGFYFQIPFLGSHSWAHFSLQPPALPAWAAFAVAMGVAVGLGLIVARIMRPFSRATTVSLMIVSFGILAVLEGLDYNTFSGYSTNVHPLIPIDKATTHFVHGFNFNDEQLMIIAVTVVLAVAVAAFFRRTHLGVAIRAVADDRQVSQLLGVNADTVSKVSWVLGSMLAGIAGILITPLIGLDLAVLTNLIVFGFISSLFGGFRSLIGTLGGGLILGIVEQLVIASPLSKLNGLPPLQDVVAFVVLVVLLMLRPKWIFSGIRVDEESGVGGAGVTFGGQAPAEDRFRAWLRKGPALWLILQDWRTARWVLGLGGMAAVMIIPIFTTGYWSTVLASGIIFALVGLSLVILTGWAGQVSLAQYAFVGVGAYTAGILQGTAHLPFWLVVPLTVLVSLPFSLLIGIPSLRLRGFFLALVTLAFAVAVDTDLFLSNALETHNSILGSTAGSTAHRPFSFTSEVFYMGLAVALACFFVAYNLRRSRTARAFLAIRDSEPTAIAFGINPTAYKLLAFCIGGGVAAAAGAVFAYLYVNMDPTEFLFITGVTFVGYGILTGIAELFGAVLVGFLFAVLPQITATPINGVNQTVLILQGVLLVLTVYSYPSGLAGFMKRLVRPDDETKQILTAAEFSPAVAGTAGASDGNGGGKPRPTQGPAPGGTGARISVGASRASTRPSTATATLPPQTDLRAPEEAEEEALWSRRAQTTRSSTSDRAPKHPVEHRSELDSSADARERPLRARRASGPADAGSRPLRAPRRSQYPGPLSAGEDSSP
jgi:ABC-type branched-subunit amino acid transport system permease subunit